MTEIESLELFDKLTSIMDGVERVDASKPMAHATCPLCGIPPRDKRDRPDNHFSFGCFNGMWIGHCFYCRGTKGLRWLYEHASGDEYRSSDKSPYRAAVRVMREDKPPFWACCANELVRSYVGDNRAEKMWNSYKPMPESVCLDSIQFGVGILPYSLSFGSSNTVRHFIPFRFGNQHETVVLDGDGTELARVDDRTLFAKLRRHPVQHKERLIVPVRGPSGNVVALHGRSLKRSEKRYKWLACSGSDKKVPWGVSRIQSGDVVWIGENYVDAAMVCGEMNGVTYRAIGVGGVGLLRDDVLAWLKERKPSLIIVALDNDLAGQANAGTRDALIKEEAEKRGIPEGDVVAPMFGPRLANQLIDAGFNTRLFRWPENAPAKAGLDWAHGVQ